MDLKARKWNVYSTIWLGAFFTGAEIKTGLKGRDYDPSLSFCKGTK
jgi:hypothetical protein